MMRTLRTPYMAAAPALAASGALVLSACGPYPVDATDQHDAAAPESAPVFGDIRQEAFDSSLAAESVTVTGEMEAGRPSWTNSSARSTRRTPGSSRFSVRWTEPPPR
ncbi:hypothetical protein [Nesterenkonia pannonica]|uniref:hypothetical protein n=1 Tax=Nesterenkonia pannonica TaxID=1548602 RepID=UPI0021644642|nr:hypothetical protein [Nesterenkonia pannonica]